MQRGKGESSMIQGVKIRELTRHVDERGYVMEILRNNDEEFIKFGQVYVSAAFPGIIKAWHCHTRQVDLFCCIHGNARVGLYDDREDSATCGEAEGIVIGELNPAIVQIPRRVWHGFMALGGEVAVVLNVPTETYNREDPDELRRDLHDPDIPFEWHVEGG